MRCKEELYHAFLYRNSENQRKKDGHLYYDATGDPDLKLKAERLRNELAELRQAFNLWQNKVLRAFAVVFDESLRLDRTMTGDLEDEAALDHPGNAVVKPLTVGLDAWEAHELGGNNNTTNAKDVTLKMRSP